MSADVDVCVVCRAFFKHSDTSNADRKAVQDAEPGTEPHENFLDRRSVYVDEVNAFENDGYIRRSDDGLRASAEVGETSTLRGTRTLGYWWKENDYV